MFNFNDAVGTAAQNVASVATFLNATNDRRTTNVTWATNPDVTTLNVGTGSLEGITSVTSVGGTGTMAGDMAPLAAQGLLRLLTGTIVAGRLLRGRIFMGGNGETDSNGGPVAGYISDYDAAGATLVADANSDWSVWSRTHGVLASISTVTTWNKWAILRGRRD